MDLNYNTVSLIDTLGLLQGLILGSLLMFIGLKKSKPTTFLGLFIIAYSLELLPSILDDIEFTRYHPRTAFLPLGNSWLLFPLFYIYVQKVSVFSNQRIKYNLLYPGLFVLAIQIAIFCLPLNRQLEIDDSIWYNLLELFGIFYSFWIAYITVKWVNRHIKEVNNQFSSVTFKELKWARLFVVLGLIFTISWILVEIFFESEYTTLIFSCINVMLLYWISLRGILQHSISSLISNQKPTSNSNKSDNTEKEPKQQSLTLLKNLDEYIVKNEIFTKPELTIIDLADGLDVHPRKISNALNSVYQQNFNSYVNGYRIEKAKMLVKSDVANNLSIQGIGSSVGFQSKSSFYTAFKKVTGTTPSKYKNS